MEDIKENKEIDLTEDQIYQIHINRLEVTVKKILSDSIAALAMLDLLKNPPG
jgi:hypothetical protein